MCTYVYACARIRVLYIDNKILKVFLYYKDEFRKIDIFSTLAHNKLWIAVYRSNNTNILTTTLVYLQYNRRL